MSTSEPPQDPSARWVLLLSAAVCWFFIAHAWLGLSSVANGIEELRDGIADVRSVLLMLLPLLAFAAPMLPLAQRWGREGLAARAALVALAVGLVDAAIVAGIQSSPIGARGTQTLLGLLGAVGIASAAVYLVAMVGLVNRRAVAGGLAGALLLRQLTTAFDHDAGFPRTMLVLGAAVALAGALALWRWRATSAPVRAESADTFERRAGGIRLRGALALGAILYFEIAYGLVFRAASVPVGPGAVQHGVAMIPPVLAWLFVVRGLEAPRHRFLAVGGALAVGLGVLLLWWPDRIEGGLVAHAAALALLGRALSPAGGRRPGRHLALGLGCFALLSVGYTLDSFPTGDVAGGAGAAGALWTAAAAVVLVVAMYLTPRPPRAPAVLPDGWAFAIALALPLATALVAAR